jgi:ligand-binding sensor domain-containing protein
VLGVAAAQGNDYTQRVLAATRAGLFAADWAAGEDGASAWRASSQGLSDPSVVAVLFAGQGEGAWPTAFAATETGRLFRSVDGGAGWQEMIAWAGLGVARVLVASPLFDEDGILFAGAAEGIYRTLDGGASWESCSFGLLDMETLCLTCAPDFAASQLVWAGTAGGGLYRSRNQARAWRESGQGLPDAAVQALAVSPGFAEDRTLFAGLEGHGVYISTDGGDSWSPHGLAEQSVNALVCVGANRLVAATGMGLFVSARDGAQWEAAAGPEAAVLAFTHGAGGRLIAGTFQQGVWLSEDGGLRWTAAAPLTAHAPPVIVAQPNPVAQQSRLAALDVDGMTALSLDGGRRWQALPVPSGEPVTALTFQGAERSGPLVAATPSALYGWDETCGEWRAHEHGPAGVIALEQVNQGLAAVDVQGRLWLHTAPTGWDEITGPWAGEAVVRVLAAGSRDEEALLVLTLRPAAEDHFAINVWRRDSTQWTNLAGLSSHIPAAHAVWSDKAELMLATQHRIIRLYTEPGNGGPAVSQHFFAEGEQVTALAVDEAGLWAATTAALYRAELDNAGWSPAGLLPNGLPVVKLWREAGALLAVTLGGQCWRLEASA